MQTQQEKLSFGNNKDQVEGNASTIVYAEQSGKVLFDTKKWEKDDVGRVTKKAKVMLEAYSQDVKAKITRSK